MYRVWAPNAEKVEFALGDASHRMVREINGWWYARDERFQPLIDYAFRIDESGPLPDPRSAWQPNGVDIPSRQFSHAEFAWTDRYWQAKPLPAALIYELHIGTFTPGGTFDSAIKRLDHLVDLGVTHVELMPIAEFEGEYGWGYDGVFPYAPHHAYCGAAGPNSLKRFVNACHARGLAVILDVVYNHLGPVGNYLPQFGPYFTEDHHTTWGWALNFDGPYSDEVRRYFCDNALMWLRDYHFDGLRLDAVHAIKDTAAIPFLEQLATEVDELKAHLGRHLVLIAESDLNDPRVVRSWELGGFGLDAQWSDDIHHSLHTVLTGEREGYYADFGSLADLVTSMERPFVYAGRHSEFRHRRHGRPPQGLLAHRFVAYLQNHDQLGNRAKGERVCHLVNIDRVKIGAALLLTSPYVPLIFQGEEFSASAPFQYFVDFKKHPDLERAVVDGRRKEFAAFGWNPAEIPDPTSPETFRRSKLNWEELGKKEHAEILVWQRQLIRLRRQHSAFTTGRLDLTSSVCDEAEQWLRVNRGNITIACNFATQPRRVPLACEATGRILLASKAPLDSTSGALTLDAESVVIIERNTNGWHAV